eukprot:gene128-136_t
MKEFSAEDIPVSLRIVGVIGHYSKGKSFIINQLRKEFTKHAMPPVSSTSWLQPFYYVDSNQSVLRAKEAPGVTTKGISGIFFRDDSVYLNDSQMLLLDTAGRNAPARGSSNEIEVMYEDISDARSKEALIDDIIRFIADTIIYVLDEVLNEDQRTVLHILEHIIRERTDQKLVVIHNFKRINCLDHETTSALLKEQVRRSFDASNSTQYNGHNNILSSSWRIILDDKEYHIEVYHVVLFNHDQCAKQNGEALSTILGMLTNNKRSHARVGKLFDIFAQTATNNVDKYIKLTKTPKDHSETRGNAAKHAQEEEERRCVGHCFRLKDISSYVQLLHWEKRPLPVATSLGVYVPKSSNYRTDSGGYNIRVDLPGLDNYLSWNDAQLKAYRNALKDSDHLCEESWVAITIDSSDEQSRFVHVVGCRPRPKGDTAIEFGYFDMTFQVPYYYISPQHNLSKGELNIAFERPN